MALNYFERRAAAAAMQTWSDKISSIFLFVTVAAAPLPFGSTDPATVAVWCIILGFAVLIASPHDVRREHLPLLGLAATVIFAYGIVLHEQLAARPWVASLHPIWRDASEALGVHIEPSVSIARNQPFFAMGPPLVNMLALICSFIVCINRDRARQLILVIAWSGAGYAIYGIVAYLIDPTHVLWHEKVAYSDSLTSTFINRNTAAVYLGSCGVLWFLLMLEQVYGSLPPGQIYWRGVPRRLLSKMPRGAALSFGMFLICLAAMLMTNSRAGVVISLMAMIVAFAAFSHRDLPRRGGVAAALAVGGLIALVFLQILGGNVAGRFDMQGLSDEGRLEAYRSTLRMIADHPWFGTGLGTFAWAFPTYRSSNISMAGIWDHAHSTPLELASDLGLPLASLVALAWAIVIYVLIRGIRRRRRDLIVPVGAVAVAILSLAHSSVDFSLQIPGYAIVVFSLVGAGLAQSFHSNKLSSRDDKLVNVSI